MKKFEVYQEIHCQAMINLKPQNRKTNIIFEDKKKNQQIENLQYDEKVMLKFRLKTSMWKNGRLMSCIPNLVIHTWLITEK